MSNILAGNNGTVVLSQFTDGYNVVHDGTPLKYVNYFDGMLMRAELMKLEQQGMHNLSQLSNQAGGHGVVWGYDTALLNGNLQLGAGMAMDFNGKVIYMPGEIEVNIANLIAKSSGVSEQVSQKNHNGNGFVDCIENKPSDPVTVIDGTQYYVITVGQIDALCGQEDVYGRLCEEACITSTDRPHRIDGVVVRAEPLPGGLILPQSSEVTLSGTHTRSRIASAFFEYEQNLIASRISGTGLRQGVWCNGARLPSGFTKGVPVALLARNGNENLFLDRWIVARERMEAPPRRYWGHVMAMRPWNMFLAQVLQFQCQINNLSGSDGGIGPIKDPCRDTKSEMLKISEDLRSIIGNYEAVGARVKAKAKDKEAVLERARENLIFDEREASVVMHSDGQVLTHLEEDGSSEEGLTELLLGSRRAEEIDPDLLEAGFPREQNKSNLILLEQFKNIEQRLRQNSVPQDSSNTRILINGGIVETPSAGYLPIKVDDALDVNTQVRNLMGEGVDLRFCVVRPDYIPHALEEAQHMERISLLDGLDDKNAKPQVDVLVPDGLFQNQETKVKGKAYKMSVGLYKYVDNIIERLLSGKYKKSSSTSELYPHMRAMLFARSSDEEVVPQDIFNGVGRGFNTSDGGFGFHYSGLLKSSHQNNEKDKYKKIIDNSSVLDYAAWIGSSKKEGNGINISQGTIANKKALWTSMSIEKNPLKLQSGQSTRARIEIDMVHDKQASNRNERKIIEANLSIRVDSSTQTEVILNVQGDLQVTLNDLSIDGSEPGTEQDNSIQISNTVHLEKVPGKTNEATLISLFSDAILGYDLDSFIARRTWTDPSSAIVHLGTKEHNNNKHSSFDGFDINSKYFINNMLAEANQNVDASVLKADHPVNEDSVAALDLIAKIAKKPYLSPTRAELLFGADKLQSKSTKVYPTKDWVLFHRRRDKHCESVLEETEVQNSNYQVVNISLSDAKEVDAAIKLIEEGNWAGLKSFTNQQLQKVTRVEFKNGTPTLLSARERVLSDWESKVLGNSDVLFAGVVNNPNWNESSSLGVSRLRQLNDVIDDVNSIHTDAQFNSISRLPPELARTGEGGMIYLTLPQKKTCQIVIGVPPVDNLDEFLKNFVDGVNNGKNIEELFKGHDPEEIGLLNFRDESDQAFENEVEPLVKKWSRSMNGLVSQVVNITNTDTNDSISLKQAKFISTLLGPSNIQIQHLVSEENFSPCWGLTILFTSEIKKQDVIFIDAAISLEAKRLIEAQLKNKGIGNAILNSRSNEFSMRFNSNNDNFNESDLKSLEDLIATKVGFSENVEWQVTTIAPKGVSTENMDAIKKRSLEIATKLKANTSINIIENIVEVLPHGADAITLLMPVDTTAVNTTVPVYLAKENETLDKAIPKVAFHFTPENELIKDEHYEKQLEILKISGVEFSEAELVGEKKPNADDKRLKGVFEALKEAGVVKVDAVKKVAKIKPVEDKLLDIGSFRMPDAFVLRRKL